MQWLMSYRETGVVIAQVLQQQEAAPTQRITHYHTFQLVFLPCEKKTLVALCQLHTYIYLSSMSTITDTIHQTVI